MQAAFPLLVREKPPTADCDRSPLERALHELNVLPFEEESVRSYMTRLRVSTDEAIMPAKERARVLSYRRTIRLRRAVAMTLLIASAFVLFIGIGMVRSSGPHVTSDLYILGGIVGAVVCGAWLYRVCKWDEHVPRPSSWMETPFDEFGGRVPSEALELKESLAAMLPGAAFYVHSFEEDPFLEVEHGGKRKFIWVWDETDFEGS